MDLRAISKPCRIAHWIEKMTEIDRLANKGRIVERYAEAKENLTNHREEVRFLAHVFERLYQALNQDSVSRIINHWEVVTSDLRKQGFDWSKLNLDSLSALLTDLRNAETEEAVAKREKIDVGII